MLNDFTIFVGRLAKIEKKENNKVMIYVCVQRNYKNVNGEYDNDFIPIEISNYMKDNVLEYCKIGDTIGVKGRLETRENELIVLAEKITFLSSK